jgi:hypothetical protein
VGVLAPVWGSPGPQAARPPKHDQVGHVRGIRGRGTLKVSLGKGVVFKWIRLCIGLVNSLGVRLGA